MVAGCNGSGSLKAGFAMMKVEKTGNVAVSSNNILVDFTP